jgi:ribosome-binding protein aMBF1 (putative translation factor)
MPAKPKDQDAIAAFADELKAWRAARCWTQAQLAAETNYSEQMIAQVETSRKPATMQMGTVLDRYSARPASPRPLRTSPGHRGRSCG